MSLLRKSLVLSQMAGKNILASGLPVRNSSTLFTPPRVRVSFTEKVIHGILITVGVSFVPCWVLYHVEDYKNGNKN